jgi:hypothetical protein
MLQDGLRIIRSTSTYQFRKYPTNERCRSRAFAIRKMGSKERSAEADGADLFNQIKEYDRFEKLYRLSPSSRLIDNTSPDL